MTDATAMAPLARRLITARNVFVVLPQPANAMEEKATVVGNNIPVRLKGVERSRRGGWAEADGDEEDVAAALEMGKLALRRRRGS
jgi:hypothetical protein